MSRKPIALKTNAVFVAGKVGQLDYRFVLYAVMLAIK
jgi:hypothetical protein